MTDEQEPSASWAAGRKQRLRSAGQSAAVRLAGGRHRGARAAPGEPGLIVRWDGYRRLPGTVAEDCAAQRILYGIEGAGASRPGRPTRRPRKTPGTTASPEARAGGAQPTCDRTARCEWVRRHSAPDPNGLCPQVSCGCAGRRSGRPRSRSGR
ncbi:DUF6087 family protein [Kitasatospora sp. NPDC057542]|uniref:DUF6087 family protein n=1 Tax=Kitasatospora sp. NPDC057542 TaxID=3346162 RepID=UPI0036CB7E24